MTLWGKILKKKEAEKEITPIATEVDPREETLEHPREKALQNPKAALGVLGAPHITEKSALGSRVGKYTARSQQRSRRTMGARAGKNAKGCRVRIRRYRRLQQGVIPHVQLFRRGHGQGFHGRRVRRAGEER